MVTVLLGVPSGFDYDSSSAEDLKSCAEFAAFIGREGEWRFDRARVRACRQAEQTNPRD
jgi:hypothetical protein